MGQLSLALALLAGGALFARAFFNLYYTDLVIDTRDVVTMRLTLPQQKYGTDEQRRQFFRRLDERLIGDAGLSCVDAEQRSAAVPVARGSSNACRRWTRAGDR